MKLLLLTAAFGLAIAQTTTQRPEHDCRIDHRAVPGNPHAFEVSDLAGNWRRESCEPPHLVFVMAERCYCGWSVPEVDYYNCSDVKRRSLVNPDLDYMYEYWLPLDNVWKERNCHDVLPPGSCHQNKYFYYNEITCMCDWKLDNFFASCSRCTMRIWGEPHIETCSDDGRQTTCSVPGLQTYLNLPFLKITGVNTQPYPNMIETWLTKLTIEFKSLNPPHDVTARYTASNGTLPFVLEIPAVQVSESDTVFLTVESVYNATLQSCGPRRVVVIRWPHTGIEILVDTWGGPYGDFYQFIMRGARNAMNRGTGILIYGCPSGGEQPNSRRDENAEAACLAVGITLGTADMDACMLDVIAMNDTSIAAASAMALSLREFVATGDEEMFKGVGAGPTYSVPACENQVADVVFLVDTSGSIESSEWTQQIQFIISVVNMFTIGPNDVQVGVVTFSDSIRTEFALNHHTEKHAVLTAIAGIQKRTGDTHTSAGLQAVRTTVFTAGSGDRTNVPNVLIVITDGDSTPGYEPNSEAHLLKCARVRIITIGIGRWMATYELTAIASNPQYFFAAIDFADLPAILSTLVTTACQATPDCVLEMDIEMNKQPPNDTHCSFVQPDCPFLGTWPPLVALETVDGRRCMKCNDCILKSWYLGNEKKDMCMYFGMYSTGQDDPSQYRVVLSDGCVSIISGDTIVFPPTFLFEYRAAPMSFRVTYHGGVWTSSPGRSGVNSWVDVVLCYRVRSIYYERPWFTLYEGGDNGNLVESSAPDPFPDGVNQYFKIRDDCQLNICGNPLDAGSKYTGCFYWFQLREGAECPIDERQ